MTIEAAPLRLVEQLRAFFQPRDRHYTPAAGRTICCEAGTLANRPATPVRDGAFYYGTDTNALYVGDAGAWVTV